MAYHERDSPQDGHGHLRHQHSASSDLGNIGTKALVPMWDSSDPDRAPPPLPLNPVSPSSFASRSATGSAVQAAHAALSERARESSGALVPSSLAKRLNDSPERGLVKNNHRRMQSLQPGTVRDLSLMIEGSNSPNASPTRSPEKREFNLVDRANTPTPIRKRDMDKDDETISIDKDFMPGPIPGPSLTPILRPTALRRPQPKSILGENTPPQSSTMLAIQSMHQNSSRGSSEPPLSNITNGSTPKAQETQPLEQLSSQIFSLTNIATSLQKEMSALSRRSRDNATDLLSLKEATNTRDEDIRKSLRDLLNVTDSSTRLGSSHFSGLYLDNKPHNTPKLDHARPFQLPRIPSPKSFSDSIDRASTPSLSGDSTASIALLEKIIREMGTKEGQESLVSRLIEVSQKLSGMASAGRVDEILDHIRTQSQNAIVHTGDRSRALSDGELDIDRPLSQVLLHNGEGRRTSAPSARGAELLNDDLIKIIRSVKDGVAQGGGLTAEVKALVRDLRGEVLGMGRELGKRLEQVSRRGIEDTEPPSKDEVSRVIDEGLEQMKDQLNHVLREHRRQSAQSAATSKTLVDYQEIYNAMRAALRDNEAAQDVPDLSRDDVIEAVRDAWENYKPEIEVQQLGLEREEVLACLKEGLQEYAPKDERPTGATREEMFKAVVEGLKHFVPPQMDTPASMTRDEIIEAVRDCLEEFEFPVAASAVPNEGVTREDMVHAVREGLNELDLPRADAIIPRFNSNSEIMERLEDLREHIVHTFKEGFSDIDLTQAKAIIPHANNDELLGRLEGLREDLLRAVKEGISEIDLSQAEAVVHQSNNQDIIGRLEEFMEHMKLQFMESKDNVSTNGRDTEQVLDATKDGLENLRVAIESYVDRATGEAGQEDFMMGMLKTMEEFKEEVATLVSQSSQSSREQLVTELEGLREIVNSSMVPATPVQAGRNEEVLEALHSAVNTLRTEILRPRSETGDILDALNEGLTEIRVGIDRMTNKPTDLTANDEILDALKSGLDSVRSDIETIRENNNSMAMAAISNDRESTIEGVLIPADMVKHDDIRNLEVLITQLRMKIEEMEPSTEPSSVQKEDLARLEEMLNTVQQGVEHIGSREIPIPTESVNKEDFDRLAELILGVQVQVEEIGARPGASTTQATERSVVSNETTVSNTDAASKDDVQAIETILRNTKARLDDLMDGEQAVRKEHLDAMETLILETKEITGTIADAIDPETRKAELSTLESLITEVKVGFDEMKDKAYKEAEDPEKVTKTHVEAVETVVLEIKNIIDVFQGVDFSTLPKKEDIDGIEIIVREAKEKIESFGESTSMALTKRDEEIVEKEQALIKGKQELNSVGDRVIEVKTFLEEFQETLKTKLEEGLSGIEGLGKLLETLGETLGEKFDQNGEQNNTIGTDLKEMFEAMKNEFEDSKSIVAGAKLESDEKLQEATGSINSKIDEKITELIVKYDAFQAAQEERREAIEARDISTEAAVVGTKAVADELKSLIDTLGTTVTESLEKMEEASQTVFGKVEELVSKSDESHTEGRAEHQQTRDQLQQALTVVEGLAGEVNDTHPKILEAIKEVLAVAGQHYEHAQSSVTLIQEKIIEAKPEIPTPENYDDTEIHGKLDAMVGELKYDDTEIHGKLDALAELKYDDTVVHEKLDKLVTHTNKAAEAFSQLETLDKVHQSVQKMAADISEFLSAQTKRITEENDDRERTLQETKVALARKRAEKDHIDASVMSLRDEEDRLRNSITILKTEQESLIRQKTRLTGDVSSLETAMKLRKEELNEMESRAERLERRILEGVMDHSRVLLMSKGTKSSGDSMNRKRVRKSINDEFKPSAKPIINMALTGKRNLAAPGTTGTSRRIASLGQITSNIPSGGVQRSQSVRTPAGASKSYRKRSWGGDTGFNDLDKENISVKETVEEVDENEAPAHEDQGLIEGINESPEDDETLRRSTMVMTGENGDDAMEGVTEGDGVQGDEVVVYEQY